MENKQIVTVFVDENSKVVKFHGINSENEPVGGVSTIGSNLVILDAHRDKNGLFWEMKIIHPEFVNGHRSDVNDVTLRLGGWKEAVEVVKGTVSLPSYLRVGGEGGSLFFFYLT